MTHLKIFTFMFQLYPDIFNDRVFKVVLDLKLCDESLIEKEQPHCCEKVTVLVAKVGCVVDLSQGSVI